MKQPFVILFAGVPGSGKSIAVNYLSTKLNLPVFSNDALRAETHFNTMDSHLDKAKFEALRKQRLEQVIAKKLSFIYDAGIDRRWPELKKALSDNGYSWKIVSFDLTEALVNRLWREVAEHPVREREPYWLDQHDEFVKNHGPEVDLKITDSELPLLIVKLDEFFQL